MKLEFSWLILEKYPNIKFYKNLSGGSQIGGRQIDRWMDIHDEANSYFSQFC